MIWHCEIYNNSSMLLMPMSLHTSPMPPTSRTLTSPWATSPRARFKTFNWLLAQWLFRVMLQSPWALMVCSISNNVITFNFLVQINLTKFKGGEAKQLLSAILCNNVKERISRYFPLSLLLSFPYIAPPFFSLLVSFSFP